MDLRTFHIEINRNMNFVTPCNTEMYIRNIVWHFKNIRLWTYRLGAVCL